MVKKFGEKRFIISVIGRDLRKTPETEEKEKEKGRGDSNCSPSEIKEPPHKQTNKNRTHYRIEYTKDGPKLWTLH